MYADEPSQSRRAAKIADQTSPVFIAPALPVSCPHVPSSPSLYPLSSILYPLLAAHCPLPTCQQGRFPKPDREIRGRPGGGFGGASGAHSFANKLRNTIKHNHL